MKIVVTGAGGFIGSRAMCALVNEGHSVVGGVRSLSHLRLSDELARIAAKENCELVEVDLEDPRSVSGLFDRAVDVVIHCASQQPRSGLGFDGYYRGNLACLSNVLDGMARRNIRRIISFSTVVVYGDELGMPVDEQHAVSPSSYYAISKYAADQILRYRSDHGDVDGVCLRLPSIFGKGQVGGLVHTYYDLLHANQELEIYSCGKLRRNLLHVDDVVRACRLVVEKMDDFRGFNLFLIGSSNSLTMEEVARFMAREIGSRSHIKLVPHPAPVNCHWDLVLEKARKAWGFVPLPIESGINLYLQEMAHGE